MPKHNFMISKAVDLVARKLAGMDQETIARLTQVLSEEAQMISEDLQHSGQNVNSDILAARLDGLVTRMKYEIRNQGPDPSPHEFPIFNVSHNPTSPYPNPINHLYDKRYKEAYSTFIKQNQPTPSTAQKNEPSTPTPPAAPSPSKPTANSNPSSYPTYPQGQFQQQSNKKHEQPSHSAGFAPNFPQQPTGGGWQYVNPYATMPRSHAAYYQQQAAKLAQPIQEQPSSSNTQHVRRSSTSDDLRPHSLSRSASSTDLNTATNSGAEKIRVRVINDNPSSSSIDPQTNAFSRNRFNSQRSILKSNNDDDANKDTVTTRRIYASPNTEIGTETMEDLFKVVKNQLPESTRSTSSPMTERIIIIDRRGSGSPDNNQNTTGKDRFRTFEIHSSPGAAAPSTSSPPTPTTTTPATNAASAGYALQQPNYYTGQQLLYQQPRMYTSVPNMYSATTPYVQGVHNYYPYVYYRY